MAAGWTPEVEEAAEAAGASRVTAYRYFPNRRARSWRRIPGSRPPRCSDENAPDDPRGRLDRTIAELIRLTIDTEPEPRTCERRWGEPTSANDRRDEAPPVSG